MEQVMQPLAAGAGRASGGHGSAVALALADHEHVWRRVPDAVGLFCCAGARCGWFAVCPACLGSLDAALRLRDGLPGMALYWCAAHSSSEEGA